MRESLASRRLLAVALAAIAVINMAEAQTPTSDPFLEPRLEMVERQIEARGIRQPEVLAAMREVPRHRFVPEASRASAYSDHPLGIGSGQTISQPFIVALMTELLELTGDEKVLEIGTGSGYQAAVLCHLGVAVYSIEIVPELSRRAARVLEEVGCEAHLRVGDGWAGWPEQSPFDAILLTAAPPEIPPPLLEQLAVGGRLVAPVGDAYQELVLIRKTAKGLDRKTVEAVRFVPMTGEAQKRRKRPPP